MCSAPTESLSAAQSPKLMQPESNLCLGYEI